MIVAAVAALILVAFNHSSKSHTAAGTQPAASDVGRQSTTTPSVTTSAAPAPATTSAAPATPATPASPATKPVAVPSATKSTVKAPAASPSTPAKTSGTSTSGTSTSANKTITYVVKRGDNLTVIAAWFHQHGYDNLYQLNRSRIGNNPNLILPGLKITVSHDGKMTSN